jgi:hypothetical protein
MGGSAAAGAAGRAGAADADGTGGASGGSGGASGCGPVGPVPEDVQKHLDLDPFYKKYVDAKGLAVLASDEPADESLILACQLLHNMLGKRDDVREELISRRARFAIIGKNEGTAEIPEYGYADRSQADIDYINQRARGLGGIVASCGEENILCLKGDRARPGPRRRHMHCPALGTSLGLVPTRHAPTAPRLAITAPLLRHPPDPHFP